MTTITREQAEAALTAVKAQFSSYLEPVVIDGKDYGPTCPEPTLVMDYTDNGHPAICWEEGPDEWAYLVGHGGTSTEERVLVAQAAKEFGVEYREPVGVAPAQLPAGVWAEPVFSCVLALLPTD